MKQRAATAKSVKAPGDEGTVHRVLRVLACFGDREQWGLNELSRELGLPRGTTHRLLRLCKRQDFVAQREDGAPYSPGPALYRLAGKLAADTPLNLVAAPILESIRDAVQETVLLTVLSRRELKMYFALVCSPRDPFRYQVDVNRLQSLAWGSAGRSLLAHLSPAEVDEVIRRAEPSPLDGRPPKAVELRRSLARIRADGFVHTHAQRVPGAHGVAVPFFDAHNEVRGNINLTIPDFRFRTHRVEDLVALLQRGAASLGGHFGGAR